MIPQEDKPIVARWIAHEACLLGEEIVWQDEWLGFYKATRNIGDITFVIQCTAERAVRTAE